MNIKHLKLVFKFNDGSFLAISLVMQQNWVLLTYCILIPVFTKVGVLEIEMVQNRSSNPTRSGQT